MAVLITGGTGFVGLNIANALLAGGAEVVLFGQAAPPPHLVEAACPAGGRLAIETGDIRDAAALDALFARFAIEKVVHGAAITASLDRERTQARLIADVNLGGTITLLEAALRHRVPRVVTLGTGSVFGSHPPDGPPLDEERDTPIPESLYGITKYAAERAAIRYRETRDLDLCVARLGNVFGRYEYDTGVRDRLSLAFQLLRAAEAGRSVRLPRTLPADWIYATDVADAIVRLLAAPKLRPLYHVSAGRSWSAADWCARLHAAFPRFGFHVVDDDAAADIGVPAPRPRPRFAIERLCADTGYRPRFGPDEAFVDYLAWRDERR